MTDTRTPETELEHDEFHSSLEIDDTSGWRVFIVPGLLLLFLVGALSFFLLYSGDSEIRPDPRVAARLQEKQLKAEEADRAREAMLAPMRQTPSGPVNLESARGTVEPKADAAAPEPAPAQ